MLFSSPIFFGFLAVFLVLYATIRPDWRPALIILASTVFYGYWNVSYVGIPFLIAAMAYVLAIWISEAEPSRRRLRLALAIAIMLTPLVVFKYANFIARQFGVEGAIVTSALPLGISFVSFTLIAYVVDVYRGDYPCSRSPRDLLAFTLFFPHLIAGPILRPAELMPQFQGLPSVAWRNLVLGLAIFTVGLFKKLVIADPVGGFVDAVYRSPSTADQLSSVVAIYGFPVQIYCDFSGYTDMAIGVALMIGVKLPNNFSRPYAAASIIDFWRRWHITLSHWLRDYIYIPLGGNRSGQHRQNGNMLATMLLGGLWHGANWTFVIWGGLHGVALVVNHALRRVGGIPFYGRLPRVLRAIIFFQFVALLWVFFRAPDVGAVWKIVSGVGRPAPDLALFLDANAFVLAAIGLFFVTHHLDDHRRIIYLVRRWGAPVAMAVMAIVWIVAISVSTGSSGKFVYFDF